MAEVASKSPITPSGTLGTTTLTTASPLLWEILCDIDDTIWPLNITVTGKIHLPLEKLIDFRAADNPLLTPAERAALSVAYGDPSIFKDIPFYEGVERLLRIEELGVKFRFKSNCYNPDAALFKHQSALQGIPGVREDQLQLDVIDPKTTGQKQLPRNLLILVDDSPYTVAHSHAKVNVLPSWPWNVTEKARAMMRGKNLCFIPSGNMAQLAEVLEMLVIRLLGEYGPTPPPDDQD